MKHLKQRLQREYEQQLDDEKGAFAMENQKMMQNIKRLSLQNELL
jgi:hypothetical protein